MKKIILSAVLSAAAAAFADTTWTGNGGNNLWSNAANWDGSGGKYIFPNDVDASKREVSIDSAVSISAELDVNGGTEAEPFVFRADGANGIASSLHFLVGNNNNTALSSWVKIIGGTYSLTAQPLGIGWNADGDCGAVISNVTITATGNATYVGRKANGTLKLYDTTYNATGKQILLTCDQSDSVSGTMIVGPGSAVTAKEVVVGRNGQGTIVVEAGASLDCTGDCFTFGRNGSKTDYYNTATIRGTVNTKTLYLPYNENSGARKAKLIIDGGTYSGSAAAEVGKNGRGVGDIEVNGGSFYHGGNVFLAAGTSSKSTVNVSASGTFTANNRLYIANGTSSEATVAVSDGGTISANYYVHLGSGPSANASLSISGGTVKVTASGEHGRLQTSSGDNSTSTLTISDGGLLQTANYAELALGSGSTSTINLDEDGVLATKYFTVGFGTATINMDGGTIRALSTTTTFLPSGVIVKVGEKGAIIDTNGNNITIPAGVFSLAEDVQSGTITKIGGGTLTLTGTLASGLALKIEGGALADSDDVRAMPIEVGAGGSILFSNVGEIADFSATYTSLTATGAYPFIGKGATSGGTETGAELYLEEDDKTVKARVGNVAYYDNGWYYNGAAQSSIPQDSGETEWTVVFLSNPGNQDFNNNSGSWTWSEVILKGATVNFRQTDGSPKIVTTHIGGEGVISLMSFGIMNISGKNLTIDEGVTIRTRKHDNSGHITRSFINKNGSGTITVNGTLDIVTTGSSNGDLHIETDVTVNGPITGDGWLVFHNNDHTTTLAGDNSNFSGKISKDHYKHTIVLASAQASSAKATWNITGDIKYTGESGATLKFGAFNATRSDWGCFYYPDNATITVEVGELGDDFASTPGTLSEGSFHFRAETNTSGSQGDVTLVKKGAGTFVCDMYGIKTLNIEEGAVVFKEANMTYTSARKTIDAVTVSDGASIGGVNGTQTIGTLTLEEGAGIRGVLAEAVDGETLPTAVTGQITLANDDSAVSLSGHPVTFSEVDAARLAAVATGASKKTIAGIFNLGNAFTGVPTEDTNITSVDDGNGKANNWLVKTANSIVSLLLEGTANGLMIIIR